MDPRAQELLEKAAARVEQLFLKVASLEQELAEVRMSETIASAEAETMKIAMSLVESNQTAPYESMEEMVGKATVYMNKQAGALVDNDIFVDNFKTNRVPSMGKAANRPVPTRKGGTASDRFMNATSRIYHNE